MNYRSSITIFGFAVPAVLLLGAIGGVVVVKHKFSKNFQERRQNYERSVKQQQQISVLTKETEEYKKSYQEPWQELLESEVSTNVTQTLKTILAGIPSKDIQQTSFRVRKTNSGFSAQVAQPSHQVELSFSGKYRAMQEVMTEFEIRMPHFHLDNMSMKPNYGTGKLTLELKYVVWKVRS